MRAGGFGEGEEVGGELRGLSTARFMAIWTSRNHSGVIGLASTRWPPHSSEVREYEACLASRGQSYEEIRQISRVLPPVYTWKKVCIPIQTSSSVRLCWTDTVDRNDGARGQDGVANLKSRTARKSTTQGSPRTSNGPQLVIKSPLGGHGDGCAGRCTPGAPTT